MIESLKGLVGSEFIRLASLVGFVACPGFALFYNFETALFKEMDFGKLLMLALALVSPVFLINLGVAYAYLDLTRIRPSPQAMLQARGITPEDKEEYEAAMKEAKEHELHKFNVATILAAALCILPLYFPLVFDRLKIGELVLLIAGLEILAFGIMVLIYLKPPFRRND